MMHRFVEKLVRPPPRLNLSLLTKVYNHTGATVTLFTNILKKENLHLASTEAIREKAQPRTQTIQEPQHHVPTITIFIICK